MKHGGPTGVKNEADKKRSTHRRNRHAEVHTQWLRDVRGRIDRRSLHEDLAAHIPAGAGLGAFQRQHTVNGPRGSRPGCR